MAHKYTLILSVTIVAARLIIWLIDSKANGRLTIPPGYDDIAYYTTALEDVVSLKGGNLSLLELLSSSRHSPFLNLIAVFTYFLHFPAIVSGESLGSWSSFYLPNIVLYISLSSFVLAWGYFAFKSLGLPSILPLIIFSLSSFSWYSGIASEFRPDIPASLVLSLSILGFFINAHRGYISSLQLGLYLSIANICCYIKPSTFPLTILTSASACLAYSFVLLNNSTGIQRSIIRAAHVFAVSVLSIIPFALTPGPSALAYIIKAQITAASIWHGHYQSAQEKWLWYITRPGKDLVNPYHPLVLAILSSLLLLLLVRIPLTSIIKQSHGSNLISSMPSIISCTVISFVPYYLIASQSNHKSIFLGSFIGISLGVIFSMLFAAYTYAAFTSTRSKRHSYFSAFLFAVVAAFWINNFTFETTFWGPSYNRSSVNQRAEHNRVVNQIVLKSREYCDSLPVDEPCRIYLGVTSYINRDLLYSYLLSSGKQKEKPKVDAPGEILDTDRHRKLIDGADIVIFSSPELPGSNNRFGFYLPEVQNHFQIKQNDSGRYSLDQVLVEDNYKHIHPINVLFKRRRLS